MKKSLVVLGILMLFISAGCNKKEEKKEFCKDCVFSYYTDIKYFGTNGTILKDYKENYKNLKDEADVQRKIFLGHVLSSDGKIEKSYVCGVEGKNAFCVEGKTDDSSYENNKKILNSIYGKDNCSEDVYGNISYMTCSKDLTVNISSDGSVRVSISKSEECYSNNDNRMYCYENSVLNY